MVPGLRRRHANWKLPHGVIGISNGNGDGITSRGNILSFRGFRNFFYSQSGQGLVRYSHCPIVGILDAATAASILSRKGENLQAGSVTVGSPVSRAAWQRHPPKSSSLYSHDWQGSGIHRVPRKRLKDSDFRQIHSRLFPRIFSKRKDLISPDVGQGKTSPQGFTVR